MLGLPYYPNGLETQHSMSSRKFEHLSLQCLAPHHSSYWIPAGYELLIPDFLLVELGFRIAIVTDSKTKVSGFQKQNFTGFRNPVSLE